MGDKIYDQNSVGNNPEVVHLLTKAMAFQIKGDLDSALDILVEASQIAVESGDHGAVSRINELMEEIKEGGVRGATGEDEADHIDLMIKNFLTCPRCESTFIISNIELHKGHHQYKIELSCSQCLKEMEVYLAEQLWQEIEYKLFES